MSAENEPSTPTKRSTPERKILGELGNSNPDSPTANLRLLTALATSLKSAPSSPCRACTSETPSANDNTQPNLVTPAQRQPEPSCVKLLPRKEKSLSLLCNKFLNLFPLQTEDNMKMEISLNSTAQALGTEKRRIYDIINVLESLEMASKAGKNLYYWYGQSNLATTLAKLKMSAIELGLENKIQDIQKVNRAYIENSCHSCGSSSSSLMVPQSPVVNYSFPDSSDKEDKSLGVMCRKFVMLFLVSLKNGVINLDIAAKVLINEQESDSKSSTFQSRYKTKVRRLYDIANVLSAIGLIEKVDLYNCVIRKPIFKYTGPTVDCINYDAETTPLVGMTTPSKGNSDTFKFRTLSRLSRLYSSTPSGNKREPRKRKLFDSDSKFERTRSSPCLSATRANDTLFRVVEMEYKRMKSSESKPKVCTTLFPRHSSDSCISPSKKDSSPFQSRSPNDSEVVLNEPQEKTSPVTLTPMVSKENLVKEAQCNVVDVTPTIGTVRINVPLEFKITPFTTPTSTQTRAPKFVKLSKLDLKKLVPISREDMELKLSSLKTPVPQATSTSQKSNISVLTQIPTQEISPGEIYQCKAVRVGNTLQFVPIKSKSDNG